LRHSLLIAGALVLIAAPMASSALPNPRALVLRQSDLPRGYNVLRANTGALTNAQAAQGNRELLRDFAAWGRRDGYSVEYEGGIRGNIASRVDLFRGVGGAGKFLAWVAEATPKSAGIPLVRRQAGLGNAAYIFRKDFGSSTFVVVEWRYRNVCAHVSGDGLGIRKTLALAHIQQRRIAD
jgi:hypothetical protein